MSVTGARSVAVLDIPVLRVIRRGDRHSVRDLHVDVRIDLAPAAGPVTGHAWLTGAVHALALEQGAAEPELLAVAIAEYCQARVSGATRTQVDIAERSWSRATISGRPRDRDLASPSSLIRVSRGVAAEGVRRIAAGFRNMLLLTPADPDTAVACVLQLEASWVYGWAELPFEPQWEQVRRAITEAYAERRAEKGAELLDTLASAVLDESPAVSEIDISLEAVLHSTVDLGRHGLENDGSVFGAALGGREVHHIVMLRPEPGAGA